MSSAAGFFKKSQSGKEQQISIEPSRDYQEVDVGSLSMEDARDIGSEWLCKQVLEELGLGSFLKKLGWGDTQIDTELMYIISKAVYSCPEHRTAQWIRDNSGVSELFNMLPDSTNRFYLYRTSKMLHANKKEIEQHLSVKTNELFDLDDKIILYDLTNTYFE